MSATVPSEPDAALFIIPAGAAGLTIRPQPGLDATRPQFRLELERCRVMPAARLNGRAAAAAVDYFAAAIAAFSIGGIAKCMDLSVAYANLRTQFGQPIGRFQAVKHNASNSPANWLRKAPARRSTCSMNRRPVCTSPMFSSY